MITVLTACLFVCTIALDQQSGLGAGAQSARAPQRAQNAPRTPIDMGLQGYSVVLVVGDMQAAGSADTVPAAARKALSDMQAFLPYKRYQLVDATWMLCCGMFRSTTSGRMRGPEEHDLLYAIDTMTASDDGKLMVRFSLRDDTGRGGTTAGAMSEAARGELIQQYAVAQKERDEAEIQQRRAKQMHAVGTLSSADLEAANQRYALARTRALEIERSIGISSPTPAARGSLLDSTFAIAVGETVVIGTSRLKGDQALIALLTAAGKPAGAR